MIYLVSKNKALFPETLPYKELELDAALAMLESWDIIQADSETTGRDPHICDLLSFQFGNKAANTQIVVDCQTIPISAFKEILESKLLIFQNAKFDLQFLYKHKIIPRKIYDTMIVEQLMYLGYNPQYTHYSLKAIADRRLGIDIDKTVRGEIIWRGLDERTILYAAGDVEYLEDIKESQEKDLVSKGLTLAAQVENAFVPSIAYLEWCGIKLDEEKWREKMKKDQASLQKAQTTLDDYVRWLYKEDPNKWKKFAHIERQGDLFTGFSTEPVVDINWSSSKQVIPFVQLLGFSTKTEDKKTGESKDSVVEKLLAAQKGVNDGFLKVYLEYQEAAKVCGTYGEGYLDAVNPITGRIHTVFKQLGAASGRMSCGGGPAQRNEDLAKYKKLPSSRVGYPQIQNLPADEDTRASFVCEKGNKFCSCDFSALEARLGADIYQEHAMIEEFLHGSGDTHSLYAKKVFAKELEGVEVKDVKQKRPDLRKKVKGVEFAIQFGGGAKAVSQSLGIPRAEAQELVDSCLAGFPGLATFKAKGSQFVKTHGYVVMCQRTGHKMFWEDWTKWAAIEDLNPTEQAAMCTKQELDEHRMAGAKWDRMAMNSPTQGSGIVILKLAVTMYFNWIVKSGYFEKVLLCNLVHDEVCTEAPEAIANEAFMKLKECMEKAAEAICPSLPIPAEPEISDHWVH